MHRFLSVAAMLAVSAIGMSDARAQVRPLRPLPLPDYSVVGPLPEGRSAYTPNNPDFRADPNIPPAAVTGIPGAAPDGSFNPTSGTMANPSGR